MKLVTGFSLKKNGEADADPEQLGRDLTEMCTLCPFARPAIAKCMARFARSRPQSWVRNLNWFLPVHLGGMGIGADVCEKGEIEITVTQRKLAAQMLADPKQHVTTKIEECLVYWMKNLKRDRCSKPIFPKCDKIFRELIPRVRFERMDYQIKRQVNQSELFLYRKRREEQMDELRFESPRLEESFEEPIEGPLDDNLVANLAMMARWNLISEPLEDMRKVCRDYEKLWQSVKPLSLSQIFAHWEPNLIAMRCLTLPQIGEIGNFELKDLEEYVDPLPLGGEDLEEIHDRSRTIWEKHPEIIQYSKKNNRIRQRQINDVHYDSIRDSSWKRLCEHNEQVDYLRNEWMAEDPAEAMTRLEELRKEILPAIHLA